MVVQADRTTLCPGLLRCAYPWSSKSSLISLQETGDDLEGAIGFLYPSFQCGHIEYLSIFYFYFLPFLLIVQMFTCFSRMGGPYLTFWGIWIVSPNLVPKADDYTLTKQASDNFSTTSVKSVINSWWDSCECNIEMQRSQDRDQE